MKFSGKIELMKTLKVIKKKALKSLQRVYFLKYILRVKARSFYFFIETSILVFDKLAIFPSI